MRVLMVIMLIKKEVIQEIIDLVKDQYGGSQTAFAEDKGLSPTYVSDVIRGRRDPGEKILNILGLKKVIRYERVDGKPQ